jgi:hypothetical protein
MSKLAIIHYMPLEYYPPVTNLLDTIATGHSQKFKSINVFSCGNVKGRKKYQIPQNKTKSTPKPTISITIKRSLFPKETDNGLIRLYKYIHFNLLTLLGLLIQRPTSLLYFESYSAWPAYIYSRFFNRNCRIFIHNHEYADKGWYNTTMHQVRYFHLLEKKWLYPRAVWNSQTNSDRLKFFHNDHPALKPKTLKVLPNYPPRSWGKNITIARTSAEHPLKVIYVGSLSFQNTYLKEFCDWVIKQNGQVQFDVYAYNLYNNVKEYLNQLQSPYINYFDKGIEYQNIPVVMSKYEVGIVFYKAYSENVINCVSNKFYEYLACGLDVWFSTIMKSTHQHITSDTIPKVIPVDFEKLDQFDWKAAIDKKDLTYQPSVYFCEEVYEELISELTSKRTLPPNPLEGEPRPKRFG